LDLFGVDRACILDSSLLLMSEEAVIYLGKLGTVTGICSPHGYMAVRPSPIAYYFTTNPSIYYTTEDTSKAYMMREEDEQRQRRAESMGHDWWKLVGF